MANRVLQPIGDDSGGAYPALGHPNEITPDLSFGFYNVGLTGSIISNHIFENWGLGWWHILARWVLDRWRAVVDHPRRRRLQRCLMYNKLLPRTGRVADVVETIAAYFPFVARGVGARGDSNHARSLWRSLCRDAACLQRRETIRSLAH